MDKLFFYFIIVFFIVGFLFFLGIEVNAQNIEDDFNVDTNITYSIKTEDKQLLWEPKKDSVLSKNLKYYIDIAFGFTLYFITAYYTTNLLNPE